MDNSLCSDRIEPERFVHFGEIGPTGAPLLAHLLDDASGQACRGRVNARWAHSQRRDLRLEGHMGLLMGLDTHCLYTSLLKPVAHTSLQEVNSPQDVPCPMHTCIDGSIYYLHKGNNNIVITYRNSVK